MKCPRCSQWFLRLQQHISKCTPASGRSSPSADDVSSCPSSDDVSAKPSASPDFSRLSEDVNSGNLLTTGSNAPSYESEAWILIDSLSTEEILHSLPPRSVHSITPSLRTLFQECCYIPLRKIEEDPSCHLGWKGWC